MAAANDNISMPILIVGRYAMGDDDDAVKEKTIIAGGGGYKFNNNFRILGYYQYTKQSLADEQAAYIKTEAAF